MTRKGLAVIRTTMDTFPPKVSLLWHWGRSSDLQFMLLPVFTVVVAFNGISQSCLQQRGLSRNYTGFPFNPVFKREP